jgi:hypothetical protein
MEPLGLGALLEGEVHRPAHAAEELGKDTALGGQHAYARPSGGSQLSHTRLLLTALSVALTIWSCQGGGTVLRAWATIPDTAALRICRDSLAGQRGGRCLAASPGGRQFLERDPATGSEAFVRYWDYRGEKGKQAYEAQRVALEARLGPPRRCGDHLVAWREGDQAVLLNLMPSSGRASDSTLGSWRVVVSADPQGWLGAQYLCPE